MAWIPLEHLLLTGESDRLVAHRPSLNHTAFAQVSLRMAAGLRARNIRQLALWFDDAAALAQALLACWRANVVATLPGDIKPDTCARLDAGVDGWLSDQPLPLPAQRLLCLDTLTEHAPLEAIALSLDDAGLLLSTSGSQGLPKSIAKSWAQLAAEITALESQWHWADTPACVLGSVNPHHMFGLPFRVLWPLCAGRPIERSQWMYPEALMKASQSHARYVWICSPALLTRLGDQNDWQAARQGLQQIYSAGGPLPEAAARSITQVLGVRPIDLYGSSETGAVAWRNTDAPWQALPGAALGLDDTRGLWVRAPWTGTADAVFTGDDARPDGNGFQLHGRLDRILKLEEKRISLPMLEAALATHPHVLEARLGKVPGVARLAALVALSATGLHTLRTQGRQAIIDALRQHLARGVEAQAIPRHWHLMSALPWNAQGKLTQADFEAARSRPLSPRFHRIDADDTYEHRYACDIPYDLRHFSGHFAQTPIVPGVLQVQWAIEQARATLQPELPFLGMEALKFQRLMRPGDALVLGLRWDEGRGKLYFQFTGPNGPCSLGRIVARQSNGT